MTANKTTATKTDPKTFLAAVTPQAKAADAQALDALFRKATGWQPQMWGPSIVGYGAYRYRYASGREGDFLATGFAPRVHGFSIYIMPGYADFKDIMARIGKHKMGKSCLEIKRLSDIDIDVLGELIRGGLDRLNELWPVRPS